MDIQAIGVTIIRSQKELVFTRIKNELVIRFLHTIPGDYEPKIKGEMRIKDTEDMDYIAGMFTVPGVVDQNNWVSYKNDDTYDIGVEWGVDYKNFKMIDKTGEHRTLVDAIKLSQLESIKISRFVERTALIIELTGHLLPLLTNNIGNLLENFVQTKTTRKKRK